MSLEPAKRFSDRVENYVKYRPGYPPQVIELLKNRFGSGTQTIVADIGSGTGIFTHTLLDLGYKVFAVEPNSEMRVYAEQYLKDYSSFTSVNAAAEATSLPDESVDLITSATAFHWFDVAKAKQEFQRILKPGGYVVLLWNVRKPNADKFAIAYDELLLKQSLDYSEVHDKTLSDERLKLLFKDGNYETFVYPNKQVFDEQGLIGRSLSSSFIPLPDTLEGQQFLKDLKQLFIIYNEKGTVTFHYDTIMYVGMV